MAHKIYTLRRKIVWKKLRGPHNIAAFLVATALGAGLFPVGPGTMGSLAGLPLAYWSGTWPFWARATFWSGMIGVGTLSARRIDQLMGTEDNQNIVIDEVIGVAVTAWTARDDLRTWVVAFLAFRFFDILKIPPVRQIDRWSKKQTNPTWSGFGVIADDLVAGLQGLAFILILQQMGIL